MNTKICTSIEQSKKLLSLGLGPSTADMYYCIWRKPSLFVGSYERANFINGDNKAVPAWSLTTLLELMPICIDNDNYFLIIERDETYLQEPIWRVSYRHFSYDSDVVERKASLIDAVFEMVCWLIEQGHIKVNK